VTPVKLFLLPSFPPQFNPNNNERKVASGLSNCAYRQLVSVSNHKAAAAAAANFTTQRFEKPPPLLTHLAPAAAAACVSVTDVYVTSVGVKTKRWRERKEQREKEDLISSFYRRRRRRLLLKTFFLLLPNEISPQAMTGDGE
jgi:hypothetical protein